MAADLDSTNKEINNTNGFGTNESEAVSSNVPNARVETARRTLIPELRATIRKFERVSESRRQADYEVNTDLIILDEQKTREVLSQIAVVAFVGPSGTGKSTRAIKVSRANNIHYIIDDGLLINGSRIVAGTTAKKATTKMESVKQALFADETRSAVMRKALVESCPSALMIIGTSDNMLSKICHNLWLNPPAMLIRIEDVSTEEEMRQAHNIRMTEGMHTIPVPSMEIKHEFSGYFSDPFTRLRQRFEKDEGLTPAVSDTERTVVRPTFSTLGSYSIADEALLDLIRITLRDIDGFGEITDFKTEKRTYGVVIFIEVALIYGYDAQRVLYQIQQKIAKDVEEYTSITMLGVNVKASRLLHSQPKIKTEAI